MKIKKLSIIVPVFNEIKTLSVVWKKLQKLRMSNIILERIWVDDGSQDGSTNFLKMRQKTKGNKFLFKDINEGKGAAIKSGLAKATGEYVIIQDSDLEYEPSEIINLVRKAEKENLEAVFGSRDREVKNRYLYPHYYWGSRMLCLMLNLAFSQKYTDPETCYKLVKTNILRKINITEKGFGMEIEIAARIASMKVAFSEVGITYRPRRFADGKKITAKDGIRAIYLIYKFWRKKGETN